MFIYLHIGLRDCKNTSMFIKYGLLVLIVNLKRTFTEICTKAEIPGETSSFKCVMLPTGIAGKSSYVPTCHFK